MHKKGLKFALILELAQLKFTYITEVKSTSSRPLYGLSSEYNSVHSILVFLGRPEQEGPASNQDY